MTGISLPHRVFDRRRRLRRAGVGVVLLRRLPIDSPMQHVWVGTKLIGLALLTIAGFLDPTWQQLVSLWGIAILGLVAARVPRNAFPRIPLWYWLTLLLGLGLSVPGHGIGHFFRLVALSLGFTLLSALVVWTTSLRDVAPALRTLAAPLRRLRVPVDEWTLVVALTVRSLPMMVDEFRTLVAARRLRRGTRSLRPAHLVAVVMDVVTAAMAVTVRRGTELGQALSSRGGSTYFLRGAVEVSWRDAVVLGVILVACVVPALV